MKTITKQQLNAMYRCTSRDELRPNMQSVYHNNGNIVATDGHILVAVKSDYNANLEGKMITKDGRDLEGKYPNWRQVIPYKNEVLVTVDTSELLKASKNIRRLKYAKFTAIKVGSKYYNSDLLYRVLNIFKKDSFVVTEHSLSYMTVLKFANDSVTMIVSELNVRDDLVVLNNENIEYYGTPMLFTIDEAIAFKDFERVNFIVDNKNVKGSLIGSFELNDNTFEVIADDKKMHLCLDRISQTDALYSYIDFGFAKACAERLLDMKKLA